MLNIIQWEAVAESDSLLEEGSGAAAKCWVFTAFCFSFSGLIGAMWIFVAQMHGEETDAAAFGAALKGLLQNLCIFCASLLFRIGRTRSDA